MDGLVKRWHRGFFDDLLVNEKLAAHDRC